MGKCEKWSFERVYLKMRGGKVIFKYLKHGLNDMDGSISVKNWEHNANVLPSHRRLVDTGTLSLSI